MREKTKHVTLFGRKMRIIAGFYTLGGYDVHPYNGWWAYRGGDLPRSVDFKSPHAAARALERKIVAAHRRLGKLIGTGGGK